MKILITGKGGQAGSWKIRGLQIGRALGAQIQPFATIEDCKRADIIVVVKRTPLELINIIRKSGRPWVFDIVDGWPQPCKWDQSAALKWLNKTITKLRPAGVIFGTERMREDSQIESATVIPHHAWPKYVERIRPISRTVKTVGYEGNADYLGKWTPLIRQQCERRGWQFVVNGELHKADIGIALRDGGGYPARYWKPGTKLNNLHALGIPALCSREAGYESIACGNEFWIDSPAVISYALDISAGYRWRLEHAKKARDSMITLESVAELYSNWLRGFI